MLFTTPIFLFIFLPLTIFLYFLADKKFKNVILFVASLFFYSWGGAKYLILMLTLIGINYVSALLIDKCKESVKQKRILLITTLLIDLGALVYFKYFNFFMENVLNLTNFLNLDINFELKHIALPIGISFFTFQILSYVIDVYRGNVPVQKNIINFGLYVMLFPQLIAGPIVRYIDIEKQINERKVTVEKFYYGIKRFIIGFSKKILLSNTAGYIADTIFGNATYYENMGLAWLGIICYALQIYHDFSGYSDMAIGLGSMFGFSFLENFNYPYISKSIKEFWRRWHISLSSWFRDYIYIPLGGSRVSKWKIYRNLLIVFFVTGFWHGASWNFIVWGLYYGVFLILERGKFGKLLEKLPSVLQRIYALLIILVGWVFFRADNLSIALNYIQGMFSFNFEGFNIVWSVLDLETITFCLIAIICSTPIFESIIKKSREKFVNKQVIIDIIEFILLVLIFVVAILYMTGSSYNPFIYFRF